MRNRTKQHLFVILALTCALQTVAQVTAVNAPEVPQDLDWQLMKEISFTSKPGMRELEENPAKLGAAYSWGKELAVRPEGTFTGPDGKQYQGPAPASVIIAAIPAGDRGKTYYVFSMYKTKGSACDKPAQGRSGGDVYSKCSIRVMRMENQYKMQYQHDFPNYCYLYGNSEQTPLQYNYTAMALDPRTRIVHFKVVQQGKTVSACNRALRLN